MSGVIQSNQNKENTGTDHYYAQIGLPEKGLANKDLLPLEP